MLYSHLYLLYFGKNDKIILTKLKLLFQHEITVASISVNSRKLVRKIMIDLFDI